MNINKMCHNVGKFISKNSPTILTVIGSVGVIVTAVLTANETPKAEKAKKDAIFEKGEDLTVKETITTVAPSYAPSVLSGALTIACFASAAYISDRQKAMLMGSFEMMRSAYLEYRSNVIDIDEQVDREVMNEIHRCNYQGSDPIFRGDHPDDTKILWHEPITGQNFYAYEKEIIDAEYTFNRHFAMNGYASLNDMLSAFGLSDVSYGDDTGWSTSGGYGWVDFNHILAKEKDGSTSYSVYSHFPPDEDYLDDWES